MQARNVQLKKVTLSFNSIGDLSAFKKECAFGDFYIDRDAFTLVGSFSQENSKLRPENILLCTMTIVIETISN